MLKNFDIHIRDPFVLVDDGKYYLYGSRGRETWGKCTGLDVYVGNDLENWDGPFTAFTPPAGFWADTNFWAPEVHKYRGSFYMFVSFKSEIRHRGTQILKSAGPLGPFVPVSEFPVTPENWECLDGTLFIDDLGEPHIVFCHEWTQIGNGTICAMRLNPDLTAAVSAPVVLFDAESAAWKKSVTDGKDDYVTDGPFLYRTRAGKLMMIWSGFSENGYVEAAAYSDNGSLYGNWKHCEKLIFNSDGGHGMLFTAIDATLMLVMHSPNLIDSERPVFTPVRDNGNCIEII